MDGWRGLLYRHLYRHSLSVMDDCGWVRVLATAEQVRTERPGMEWAAKAGLVRIHGAHRSVLLVEALDVPWG